MELPTGEVTFCFTDIEGSTALLTDLGTERYGRVLNEHRAILLREVERSGGVHVNSEGDGMLFAWQDSCAALDGCAAAQRGLAGHDWPYGVVVRVRMGVHTGAAVATADGDYVGLAVHQAARIGAAGNGGQILLSPATMAAARDGLPDGHSTVRLGEFHVRDFAGPIVLHQLQGDGLIGAGARPLRVPAAAPRNFAADPTSFVGRESDVEKLQDLLRHHPLVTVVGPGGVGKTRLAREVARSSTGAFRDGVWLVELEGVESPSPTSVALAIAAALGLSVPAGASAVGTVTTDLIDQNRLMVLDACENVLDATAEIVEAVTSKQGRSTFLATTREALAVRGEQRWPLGPLPAPESIDADPVDVANNPAGQLFADRARSVQPGFAIDDATAKDIVVICRTVDGIPLALELAAARLADIEVAELATSVQRVLELRGGYRSDPARHRTMRALVAWSAESLSPAQRAVYTRLAPLRGWAFREAAVAAASTGNAPPLTAEAVAAALDALVAKSILLEDQSGRIRMLDPVREHAAEELAASGEEDEVMSSLLKWTIDGRQAAMDAPHRESTTQLPQEQVSFETMRALLRWARDADAVSMAQLLTTLQVEFVLGGHWAEGLQWVDEALTSLDEEHIALRAALFNVAGSIVQTMGDGKSARDMAERGLAAAEAALEAEREGRPTGAASGTDVVTSLIGAANTLGASLLYERRVDEAEEMFNRTLEYVAPRSRAMLVVRNNLASVCLARGDFAGAEASLRQAASIASEAYDPNGAHVRLNLAALRGIAGDHAGAAAELEAGIEAAHAIGAVNVLAMAEVNLGIARRNLGDPRFLETLRRGIRRARDQQDLMALVEGMKALADVVRTDPLELRAVAEDLGAVASRIPNDATSAWSAALSAVACAATGDEEEANTARRRAVETARSADLSPADAALVLLELANSLVASAPERAARLLGAADAALPPGMPEQPSWSRVHESIRSRLGETLAARLHDVTAEGGGLDLEAALDLA